MCAATAVETILASDEGPAAEVFNPAGAGPFVLTCEHASRYVPRALGDLGLDDGALRSHIAWDPGALELARALSALLDAPLVASRVSRLVFDCNRPPTGRVGIAARSEHYAIPGNRELPEHAVAARIDAVYAPFRDALAGVLEARRGSPAPAVALVSVHSFTPVFLGTPRSVEVGILHDIDTRLADALLDAADDRLPGRRVERNQPYGPRDGVTHTLQAHALPRGLPNAMIEVRNDLLAEAGAVKAMARSLSALLDRSMQALAS